MNKYDIAYIAGLFDGEGTFTITEQTRAGYPTFVFTEIYITNSDKTIMEWLSSKIQNGKIRVSRNGKKGWKDVYKFYILRKDRENFIRKLLPFLVIKNKQALIVLKLLEMMRKQQANVRGRGGLTESERTARHELAQQIRIFNKRGVKISTVND